MTTPPARQHPLDFAGRHVLVTGAAVGIGAAIARRFGAFGATVTVTDRDEAAAAALAAALPRAHALALDVTDAAATDAAFERAIAASGPLDVVVANAGVSTMRPVVDLTEADWDFNMDVNAKGVFLTNRAAVRHFLADGRTGVIVNTASMAGKIGAPFLAHYSASKFAVIGFTQALAREVAARGIRVNAVCPGYVVTSMQTRELEWEASLRGLTVDDVRALYLRDIPLGRLETPEDVARVVLFLASDEAAYMTGQAINVTGGARMD
jgi:meso-butanediol dehydrogenase / (S,S)-butanediol dehydrogenase / diacetyl reductase